MAGLRRAAVLMPFHRDGAGELRLVLIRRTERGNHAGQIAFPGGNREPADPDMRHTAIREAHEELGLAPEAIEILDELPAIRTLSSGYLVWPFIGRLRAIPERWRPQESEVAEVLDVSVRALADPTTAGTQLIDIPAANFHQEVPVRRIDGHTIWGLTLRILEPILPRVLAGEYPL